MRTSLTLLTLSMLLTLGASAQDNPPAADADAGPTPGEGTQVHVTVHIPAELESFQGTALVATLYAYDPFLADVGATRDSQLVVRHLGHQQGVGQTLTFTLGDAEHERKERWEYYVSCRIYVDEGDADGFVEGAQVHYCGNDHPNLPGKVFEDVNGWAVAFTAQ